MWLAMSYDVIFTKFTDLNRGRIWRAILPQEIGVIPLMLAYNRNYWHIIVLTKKIEVFMVTTIVLRRSFTAATELNTSSTK